MRTGPADVLRFGVFEVDLRSGELRKQGVRIKLQDQPFHVLAVLLQHPGEVVTREELRSQNWPADTIVGLCSTNRSVRWRISNWDAPTRCKAIPPRPVLRIKISSRSGKMPTSTSPSCSKPKPNTPNSAKPASSMILDY
jgi:hypothetical protein